MTNDVIPDNVHMGPPRAEVNVLQDRVLKLEKQVSDIKRQLSDLKRIADKNKLTAFDI